MLNRPSCRVHAFLLANIALGIAIFGIATYLIVAGEYSSLAERNSTEALLNSLSISGLVYAAVTLIIDVMSRPFLCAAHQEQH